MPSNFEISLVETPSRVLTATIQRVSDGFYFVPGLYVFQATPLYSAKKISLLEGIAENAGSYTASVANVSGPSGTQDPGLVRVRIHDESAGNATIAMIEGYVVGGALVGVDAFVSSRATPSDIATKLNSAFLSDVAVAELRVAPPKTPTLGQALSLLYMVARNRISTTKNTMTVFDDANKPIFTADLSDDQTTFDRSQMDKAIGA